MIDVAVRAFLEDNIDLIDNNQWKEFYDILNDDESLGNRVGIVTDALLAAGIDPLDYLSEIPFSYLDNSNIEEFNPMQRLDVVGAWACLDAVNLKKVILPEGIETISVAAFSGCTMVEYIELPRSLQFIDRAAFEACVSLITIKYRGTMQDWYDRVSIAHENVFSDTPKSIITCADGKVIQL